MCAALGIIYWPFARGNHKDMTVEKNHHFIYKNSQLQAKTQAHMMYLSRMRKPLSTPVIAPHTSA